MLYLLNIWKVLFSRVINLLLTKLDRAVLGEYPPSRSFLYARSVHSPSVPPSQYSPSHLVNEIYIFKYINDSTKKG